MFPIIVLSNQNDKIDEYLNNFVKKNNISPLYTYKIYPPHKEITIDQIREIQKDIAINTDKKRLFIINSFHNANLESQNAFLKTLEEKSDQNIFIMVAENTSQILPTVKSRSKIIKLQKNQNPNYQKAAELIEKIETETDYSFLADNKINNIKREEAENLLKEIIWYLKNNLINKKTYAKTLKKSLEINKLLNYNNLNPQLAIDSILIFHKKNYKKSDSI